VRVGLYGKLPAKRDFVAVGAPRAFLGVWEPWIQGGLSASQDRLGPAWREAYLRAPIWRFWLGQGLCGGAVAGAFMASVDGVGRYFPLTLFAVAEPPETIPPPEIDPMDLWHDDAEQALLSALDPDATLEALIERLDALTPSSGADDGPGGMIRLKDGSLATAIVGSLPERLAVLRRADQARAYAGEAYWWTLGGGGFPPLAVASRSLPDPHLFAAFLTGEFGVP